MKKVKRAQPKKPGRKPQKKPASFEKLRPTDKGRDNSGVRRGSTHGNAKLTEAQVRQIKRRLAKGESFRSIALKYEVSPRTIGLIYHGVTWVSVKI